MEEFWVVATKIEKIGVQIDADSEEDAKRIAAENPDWFDEYGMEEEDPVWNFEVT